MSLRAPLQDAYDSVFARDEAKVFEDDKNHSRLITPAEFKNRSKSGKLLEAIARLFRRELYEWERTGASSPRPSPPFGMEEREGRLGVRDGTYLSAFPRSQI